MPVYWRSGEKLEENAASVRPAIGGCYLVTDASICRLAENCSGLEVLRIREASITPASVEAIAAHCPDLRELDIAHCIEGQMSLAAIARGCRKLQYLDITAPHGVTEEAVLAVSRYCTQLAAFLLSRTPPVLRELRHC
eukprot:jgi/Mesvir1/25448/Mv01719-RA.1